MSGETAVRVVRGDIAPPTSVAWSARESSTRRRARRRGRASASCPVGRVREPVGQPGARGADPRAPAPPRLARRPRHTGPGAAVSPRACSDRRGRSSSRWPSADRGAHGCRRTVDVPWAMPPGGRYRHAAGAFQRLVERVRGGASLSAPWRRSPDPARFPPTVAAPRHRAARSHARPAGRTPRPDEAARARLRSAWSTPGAGSRVSPGRGRDAARRRAAVRDPGRRCRRHPAPQHPGAGRGQRGLVRWWWLLLALVAALATLWRGWRRDPANRARWDGIRLTIPCAGRLERVRERPATRGRSPCAGTGVPLWMPCRSPAATVANTAVERRARRGRDGRARRGALAPRSRERFRRSPCGYPRARSGGHSRRDDRTRRGRGGGGDGAGHAALVSLVEPALIVGFGASSGSSPSRCCRPSTGSRAWL